MALIAIVAAIACTVERPDRVDTVVLVDTVYRDTLAAPGTTPGNPIAVDSLTTDTLVGLAPLVVDTPRIALSPRVDSAPRRATGASARDTSTVLATDAELRALAATLAIPVDGIRATDLRDGYAQARGTRVHEALDIPAPRGTPVRSASDGKLTKLHNSVAGGLMVYAADPTDRFIFMYGHLDRYADGLVQGMPLRRGQLLGYVGTTGNAPPGTPHLHFAVARGRPSVQWWKGMAVNPYPLLVSGR